MSNIVGSTVLKLNNGFTMAVLGLGTWAGKQGDVKVVVETALLMVHQSLGMNMKCVMG